MLLSGVRFPHDQLAAHVEYAEQFFSLMFIVSLLSI
jgi:hypothetical protein